MFVQYKNSTKLPRTIIQQLCNKQMKTIPFYSQAKIKKPIAFCVKRGNMGCDIVSVLPQQDDVSVKETGIPTVMLKMSNLPFMLQIVHILT